MRFAFSDHFTNEASANSMRLFTALDPPTEALEDLASLQQPDALDARWSPPDQFHVTLRFIGDVDAEEANRYQAALEEVEARRVNCVPYGLDVLPSRRNPNVLIVGFERTDNLMQLYESVSEALEQQGLAPEDRTYRPHVTLARLKNLPAKRVHAFLETADASSLDSFTVEAFHLYESTLTPDGAIHDSVATVPLHP